MQENPKLEEIVENLKYIQQNLNWNLFVSELLVSLAAALFASFLYRFFYERRATGSQVHRAFPLLALSITTLFIGIQTSLPLSLGLLGALSIIRFRTPIKEPEEVGFIMLVIASSIMAATYNFAYIVALHALAFITLLVLRGTAICRWIKHDGLLVVTFPRAVGTDAIKQAEEIISGVTSRLKVENVATAGEVTTCQYIFSNLAVKPFELQKALESASPTPISINIYMDRPGGLK